MPRGSLLVIYSDGLIDTMNVDGDLFGLDRLKEIISTNKNNTAMDIRDAILHEQSKFRGEAEAFDDLTLVVIKSL
jgi:sigma-B regulation protein RsbU (phosphoserine phosphatase)